MGKQKKYHEGLCIDIKTICPECQTEIGKPGCTVNRKIEYSKYPKYKRPWRYDLYGNVVIYSGTFQRYYCSKCKRSFHDEFLGYEGKKVRPIITKSVLKLIDKIIDAYESKNTKRIKKHLDMLIKKLKINEKEMSDSVVISGMIIGDKAIKEKNKAEKKGIPVHSPENNPSPPINHPLHYNLNSMRNLIDMEIPDKYLQAQGEAVKDRYLMQFFIRALEELFHYYPTIDFLIQKIVYLIMRYDFGGARKVVSGESFYAPVAVAHSFAFNKEMLLMGPCHETNPVHAAALLLQQPDDFELKSILIASLYELQRFEVLERELNKIKNKKIYGWYVYKSLLERDRKQAIKYLIKSIYRGELVRHALSYLSNELERLRDAEETYNTFKQINLDLKKKIFPRISRDEWLYYDFEFKELSLKHNLAEVTSTYHKEITRLTTIPMVESALTLLLDQQTNASSKISKDKKIKTRKELLTRNDDVNYALKVLNTYPTFHTVYWHFVALYIQEKYDEALKFYKKTKVVEDIEGIEKDFDLNWHYFMLGHCYLTKRQFKKALKYFNAILVFDSNLLEYAKIMTYIAKKDKKEAISRLNKLLEYSAKNSEPALFERVDFLSRGKYYFEKERKFPKKFDFSGITRDRIISQMIENYPSLKRLTPFIFLEIYNRLESFIINNERNIDFIIKVSWFLNNCRKYNWNQMRDDALEIIKEINDEQIAANVATIASLHLASRRSKFFDAFKLLISMLEIYPKNKLVRDAWEEITEVCKKKEADTFEEYKKCQDNYQKLINQT